jgi:hypothetical protein
MGRLSFALLPIFNPGSPLITFVVNIVPGLVRGKLDGDLSLTDVSDVPFAG